MSGEGRGVGRVIPLPTLMVLGRGLTDLDKILQVYVG